MKYFLELLHCQHPVQEPRAIVSLNGLRFDRTFTERHVTGYGFQDIMVRKQSFDTAILVHNQDEVAAGAFDVIEHL